MTNERKQIFVNFVFLRIPMHALEEMRQRLISVWQECCHADPPADVMNMDRVLNVRALLYHFGYETSVDPLGQTIVFDACVIEHLDPNNDPVLRALDGITPSGSYLTYFDEENGQFQVRYNRRIHWVVQGEVLFPPDAHVEFPERYKPGKREKGRKGESDGQ